MAATQSVKTNSGLDVFIRWRPLHQTELERGDVPVKYGSKLSNKTNTFKLQVEDVAPNENANFDFTGCKKRPQLSKRGGFSGYGFQGIISEDTNNIQTYEKSIQTLVQETILEGNTGSCFAYGMTGSGKTHTMIGYGEEKGMYILAAHDILSALQQFKETSPEIDLKLDIRFAELYNRYFYDLLNGRKRSQILEGDKGEVLLRSTEKNEDGLWVSGNITDILCSTPEEVETAIQVGLELRKSGTSTSHCQSSRSHAVIEMEIVTEKLANLRRIYNERDAELTVLLNEVDSFQARKKIEKIETLKRKMKNNLKLQKEELAKHPCIGGTLIFCDLAGAEIGNDVIKIEDYLISTGHSEQQTEQERLEAKEINLSLMALAEVFRIGSSEKRRIPYRSSPLTMYLRKFLQRKQNCKSAMMVNVSPSLAYKKMTVQNLRYAKLLAETQAKKTKKLMKKRRIHKKKLAAAALEEEERNSPVVSSGSSSSSEEKNDSSSEGEN